MTDRVYISGPITGQEDTAAERFGEAERYLKSHGYTDIVNPYKINKHMIGKWEWSDFMKADLALLKDCQAIYMLPGWATSKGACIEYQYAMENGIKVFYHVF